MKGKKVYVEQITEQMGVPPYENTQLGNVYGSIEDFEQQKDNSWNGECEWKLSQDKLGEAGLDFKTYTLLLTTLNGRRVRYFVTIQGKIIQ